MDFRADLHIHSYFSDGTMSPEEILYLAKENNLAGLSITDHDTIEAYTKELFDLAKKMEIRLIRGVEISSELNDEAVHILAYNFDVDNLIFKEFLNEVQKKRRLRNIGILKKLNEKKIQISEEELNNFTHKNNIAQTIVGRVHIAQLMVEKGYVNSFQKAFEFYLQDKGPCYVRGFKFLPNKIIDEIHKINGKAILAHPNLIKNKQVINNLLNLPFDGLEAYYGKLIFSQEQKWVEIAKKHNMLITGGSDFHGNIRPYITLGCSWVNEENFNNLIK